MKHRASIASAVAVAVLLLAGYVQAGPPDPAPGPPQPVREANLDDDGWIAVHEQGTANVNVTGGALEVSGTISVDNFPSNQDVTVTNLPSNQDVTVTNLPSNQDVTVTNLPSTQNVNVTGFAPTPATVVKHLTIAPLADEVEEVSFATINVTTLIVNSMNDDEFYLYLGGPSQPADEAGVIAFANPQGDDLNHSSSFVNPIAINGYVASCANESNQCILDVTLVGFAA